jgi:hypothetical protein
MDVGRMVDWLNQNQGFAIALLTLVYVVTTVIIAIIMARSNYLASKNIRLSIEFEKSRSRPNVIFDIVIENRTVHAVLKNIGQSPAKHISVSV